MARILPTSSGAGSLKYCLMHQASQPTLRNCTTQQTIARPSTVCALAGSHCQSPELHSHPGPGLVRLSSLRGRGLRPASESHRRKLALASSALSRMTTMATDKPDVPDQRAGVPSRNPLPLSASQESQVRDIYYARVRSQCAEEIKGACM